MKNIVVYDEYSEIDLKPAELLKQYTQLAQEDVASWLKAGHQLKPCACPACHSQKTQNAFVKFGLQYQLCGGCGSLFISPRPDDEIVNSYFVRGKARQYWREEFSRATGQKRKEKIIKPRFQWVLDSAQEYLPQSQVWLDINTSQSGYIEEMSKTGFFKKKILLNPFLDVKKISIDGKMEVIDKPWWQAGTISKADVITIFEVVDYTCDIEGLFAKIRETLNPNGLCFLTATLMSGFDLQILGEKAENLYPPDRLNVFTTEGLNTIFQRFDFECLEFSTPGILDLEIVEKAILKDPSLKVPGFVEYLIRHRSDDAKKAFQEFLQSNLLSSYGRVLIRKR